MGRTASTQNATLCGDPACRVREVQARARFASCPRNPLRRSRVSSARNAGESARATLCGDRARRVREMQARVRFVRCPRNPLGRSCVSSARNAGESAIRPALAQPSGEIVRVECAKCRRECDASGARAEIMCVWSARNAGESAICPVRAQPKPRVRATQARVRFVRYARNPLRRLCVSSARNTGESAICRLPAQPSAEIARVREMQARARASLYARNPLRRSGVSGAKRRRLCSLSTTLVLGVSVELEDENW